MNTPSQAALLTLMRSGSEFIGYRPEFTIDDHGGITLSVIHVPLKIERVWYIDTDGVLTTVKA